MATTTGPQFSAKDPDAKIPLDFDFTPDLPAGVILTGTPTVTVTTYSGTDPTPAAILNGAPAFDSTNTHVILPVQGGVLDASYQIVVECTTNLPTLSPVISALLPVARAWSP